MTVDLLNLQTYHLDNGTRKILEMVAFVFKIPLSCRVHPKIPCLLIISSLLFTSRYSFPHLPNIASSSHLRASVWFSCNLLLAHPSIYITVWRGGSGRMLGALALALHFVTLFSSNVSTSSTVSQLFKQALNFLYHGRRELDVVRHATRSRSTVENTYHWNSTKCLTCVRIADIVAVSG